MTNIPKYKNARDFRTALETRLKADATKNQIDLGYLRKLVAFERCLARLFQKPNPKWYLKGGYTMELRFDVARTTMDIDLGAMGKFPTEPEFSRRGTHVPPKTLSLPPSSWNSIFDRLTEDVGITTSIADAFKLVHKNYLDITSDK